MFCNYIDCIISAHPFPSLQMMIYFLKFTFALHLLRKMLLKQSYRQFVLPKYLLKVRNSELKKLSGVEYNRNECI